MSAIPRWSAVPEDDHHPVAGMVIAAQQFGATHVINGSQEDTVKRVRALTGGYGVDYAFEVISRPETIEQAYESLRKGGMAVVVGISPLNARV